MNPDSSHLFGLKTIALSLNVQEQRGYILSDAMTKEQFHRIFQFFRQFNVFQLRQSVIVLIILEWSGVARSCFVK